MLLILNIINNKMPKYNSIRYGEKDGKDRIKNFIFEENCVVRIITSIRVARGYKIKEHNIFGRNIERKQRTYPETKTGVQRATIQILAMIENKETFPK